MIGLIYKWLKKDAVFRRVADGVGNSTNRNGDAKTIAECCDACTKMPGCALFIAKPNAIDGHGKTDRQTDRQRRGFSTAVQI